MPDAAYYRKWRASHPEYRARQVKIQRERNRRSPRKRDYKREYQQRLDLRRLQEPRGGALLESSLIRKAKQLALRVKQPDNRTYMYDDTYEELVSECLLAMCEGRDPGKAMHRWMSKRRIFSAFWAPLYE